MSVSLSPKKDQLKTFKNKKIKPSKAERMEIKTGTRETSRKQ